MKTIAFVFALLLCVSLSQAQMLTAAQAKAHEGQVATVCGNVASGHTAMQSRGVPTFINLDAAYPAEIFTILIWGNDRQNVRVFPPIGSRICVTGLIQDYRGVPEIIVRSKKQLGR